MSGGDLLPPGIQDDLAAAFCSAVPSIVDENGLPDTVVDISSNELALALGEARKDLVIMGSHRKRS